MSPWLLDGPLALLSAVDPGESKRSPQYEGDALYIVASASPVS